MKVYWTRDECTPLLILEKKDLAYGEIEIPADLKSRFLKAEKDFWEVQNELEYYLESQKVFKKEE